jgi:hypothetical protein
MVMVVVVAWKDKRSVSNPVPKIIAPPNFSDVLKKEKASIARKKRLIGDIATTQ